MRLPFLMMVCWMAATPLRAGLVGYWPFDGNAQDLSGKENHGTVMDAGFVNTVPTVLGAGQALNLESPEQHVLVPANPSLNSGIFTLSMFVNDKGQSSNINRFTSRTVDTFETGIDKVFGTDSISYYSPSAGWVRTGEVMEMETWNHLAYVSDGETMSVYLNGATISEAQPFTASPTGALHIGNRWNDTEGFFGMMDDVALWNVALPASSIMDLAKGTKRPPQIPTPDEPPPPPVPFFSVGSNVAQWRMSTESVDGGEAGEWIPTDDPLPALNTYTLEPTAAEAALVGHIYGAATAMDVEGLIADNDTHFYRTTFQMDRTSGFRTEIQLAADNGAQLYLNGQLLGVETSFLVENWGAPFPGLSIDKNGAITANKLEESAANFTGWKMGENELILAVRNPNSENSPAGGFAFRMDFYGDSAGVRGDFDNSGTVDAADIDALNATILAGGTTAKFDLNQDGAVNGADRDELVVNVLKTYYGDSNLDGEFNSSDFVVTFTAGEYEDALNENSRWATGDWNGDKEFNSSDFVKAFSNGGYEQGPRAAAAVPEPATAIWFSASLLAAIAHRRRQRVASSV